MSLCFKNRQTKMTTRSGKKYNAKDKKETLVKQEGSKWIKATPAGTQWWQSPQFHMAFFKESKNGILKSDTSKEGDADNLQQFMGCLHTFTLSDKEMKDSLMETTGRSLNNPDNDMIFATAVQHREIAEQWEYYANLAVKRGYATFVDKPK